MAPARVLRRRWLSLYRRIRTPTSVAFHPSPSPVIILLVVIIMIGDQLKTADFGEPTNKSMY